MQDKKFVLKEKKAKQVKRDETEQKIKQFKVKKINQQNKKKSGNMVGCFVFMFYKY